MRMGGWGGGGGGLFGESRRVLAEKREWERMEIKEEEE